MSESPRLEFLGDQGVLARFTDEARALAWAEAVRQQGQAWLLDVVGAYTTVAVFHDPGQLALAELPDRLAAIVVNPGGATGGALRVIPCCYEVGPDLERVARHVGTSPDEVVRLHGASEYTVYAIGFCPGFPYLGYLPTPLCGVPRLDTPRLRVEPGSVGLTGRQTGIYPEARPGGWNLVGRTPLVLVDVATGYFPLRTGDRVRFARIDRLEFDRLLGQRLDCYTPVTEGLL
ncbi:MAG: carboxyltransferase domain-containing protein [Gemmataceae bacterium]